MFIRSRAVALIYRLVAVALIAVGLYRYAWEPSLGFDWRVLLFYTGLSNVLCLAWMAVMARAAVAAMARSAARGTTQPWPRLGAAPDFPTGL
jgi:hypothetical protein